LKPALLKKELRATEEVMEEETTVEEAMAIFPSYFLSLRPFLLLLRSRGSCRPFVRSSVFFLDFFTDKDRQTKKERARAREREDGALSSPI
jgi:hypothetical protein